MEKNKNLHELNNADKAWEVAREQTKYNEQGQVIISKDERESEPDWE